MLLRALLAVIAFMFAVPAWADARAELRSAFTRTLALKSFRATMSELPGGRVVSTIEFQAPDRYRITATGQSPSLIIGDSMYIDAGGHSMKIPLPKNMLGKFRNEEAIAELEKDLTVEALGPALVGRQPARKFRFTSTGKHAATTTAWIGIASGRVLQFETTGKAGGKSHSMRMVYSDFDSPAIKIAAPR